MSKACCCTSVRAAPPLPSALAVHAVSGHAGRRLRALLHAHSISAQTQGAHLVVAAADLPRLTAALEGLNTTERRDLLAAPWTGAGLQDWQAAPLASWLRRLGTPWFAAAAQALFFHLQPVVRLRGDKLRGGEVYGYEALVRARVEGEVLAAGELLAAAEAHGELRAFDAMARRGAITQAYPQLAPGQVLLINFAPGVVYNPDICLRTTFEACGAVGADFGRLLFEVTEGEAFPDLALLRSILERYRAEGARVALDDLGAGHTSLSYLAELRPDVVKLDRDLIRDLHELDPRLPLVGSLIRYAHDLGIEVIAEGIETARELRLVRELGADYAQGYFLGRPAPTPQPLSGEAAAVLGEGPAAGV